jgi:hypothetical protein
MEVVSPALASLELKLMVSIESINIPRSIPQITDFTAHTLLHNISLYGIACVIFYNVAFTFFYSYTVGKE